MPRRKKRSNEKVIIFIKFCASKKGKEQMMEQKKVVISVFIVFIIVAIFLGFYFYHDYQNKQYEVEKVTSFQYYAIYENGKMGVIDLKGNVLIEPKYDNIKIPNPEKAIFICQDGDKIVVQNDKKETLFQEYEEVTPIDIKGIATNIPYEKRVLRYKQDGKYGLINYEGKIVTKAIYEEIEGLENKESELLVKKDGKYGVINQKGVSLLKIEYDSIVGDGYYDEQQGYALSGYIVSLKTQEGYRYGYISAKREKILEVNYNSISRVTGVESDKEVYLIATKNGQTGVVKNGKVMIHYTYQTLEYDDYNNLFMIERNAKYGVIDMTGKEILPVEYDEIESKGIYLQAMKEETATYFDIEGNRLENNEYESVFKTDNENYLITIDVEGQYGVINAKKEVIIQNTYQYLEYLYDDYFIASNESYLGVINTLGKTKVEFQYDVLQKIEDTKVLEAKKLQDNTTDLYSSKLEKICTKENASVYAYENDIEISSKGEVEYFDVEGNSLKENQTQNHQHPETIGEYHRVYYGYGESYYTKETEEE